MNGATTTTYVHSDISLVVILIVTCGLLVYYAQEWDVIQENYICIANHYTWSERLAMSCMHIYEQHNYHVCTVCKATTIIIKSNTFTSILFSINFSYIIHNLRSIKTQLSMLQQQY